MDMTTTKTVVVFGVIFACFAVLYPKIFHPMLLHVLGVSSPKQGTDDISAAFSQVNRVPPHLRKGPGPARVIPGGDEISRHMRDGHPQSFRPGPHPGLRAAAEMKKQTTTTTGSGKGMMGVVLPMYAVGIVIYLIYTLSKVFGKKEEKEKKEDFLSNNPFSEIHYDSVQKQFQYNDESDEEAKEEQKKKTRQRDLERLLLKADERNISYKQLCDQILHQSTKVFESEGRRRPPDSSFSFLPPFRVYHHNRLSRAEIEMRQLKERLLETEAQMSRILKAMEVVSDNVPAQDLKESAPEQDVPPRPVDSSPDMDSYEIINGENSASRGDPDGNVEDVGPLEKVEEDIKEGDHEQSNEATAGSATCGEDQATQEAGDPPEPAASGEVSPKHTSAVLEEGQDDTVEEAENEQEEVTEEMIPEKKEEDDREEPRPDLRKRKSRKPQKDN